MEPLLNEFVFPACPDHCDRCTVNADGDAECDACSLKYGPKADKKTCLGWSHFWHILLYPDSTDGST